VKKLTLLAVPVLLLSLSTKALPPNKQKHINPPKQANFDDVTATQETSNLHRRIDLAQMQKEADDLAYAAQTIPSAVASVRNGMLPRDVIAKLKQIEKMSKRLRNQLGS
jgi:hypothetical protein